MRHLRPYRSSGLGRPLTLLRPSSSRPQSILAVGAVALSSTALERPARAGARGQRPRRRGVHGRGARAERRRAGASVAVTPRALRRLRTHRSLSERRAWAQRLRPRRAPRVLDHHGRIGSGAGATSPDLKTRAYASDAPTASSSIPSGKARPSSRYGPRSTSRAGRVVGAAEVSLDDDVVERDDRRRRRARSGSRSALVFGLLWLALALLVRGASARLRAQNDDLAARSHDLVESTRELEATLLETIETLNAAVEARDPYTAGHSQRVRRVSLAIGRELRSADEAARRARHRRPLPRHREDRHARLDPHEARPTRPRGAGDHARARHARRGDRRREISSLKDSRPGDPTPSRALGRPRLPGRPERDEHPDRGRHHRASPTPGMR